MDRTLRVMELNPTVPPIGWKKELGIFGIDEANNDVFIDGEYLGAAFLLAGLMGAPMVDLEENAERMHVSVNWVIENAPPEKRETFVSVRQAVRAQYDKLIAAEKAA